MAMDTITDLLAVVEELPEPGRAEARARIAEAMTGTAPAARAALGVLALDLIDLTTQPETAPSDTAQPVRRSA